MRRAQRVLGAWLLVVSVPAFDTGERHDTAGEPDVVLLGAAPRPAGPDPIRAVQPSDPEPVPMPEIVPAEPGPVPMPEVTPAEPGPVPMPTVRTWEPGSVPDQGPGALGRLLERQSRP
jgi:hypothetical protein